MARKSAAALATVAIIPSARREPPGTLAADEAAEWRLIVERMPADHFQAENLPLLEDYCRSVCLCRYLGARLAALRLQPQVADHELTPTIRLYSRASERLNVTATKLRLTQQTRDPRRSGHKPATTGLGDRKPWQGYAAKA